MKSILQKEVGPAEAMYIGESPLPLLKEKEVLIQVRAFSINRADILQRKGKYPSPPGSSPLMGLEVAGIISQASPSSKWKVGDCVFGLLPGGGYAEYAAADEDLLFPMDPEMSFETAAAIPEVFLTAFLALHTLGELKEGETVLIHAASGGVGTAAIQLAKAMKATVVITASKSKHPICKELGADLCIDYKESSWAETLQKELGKNPINLIIDFLGASYFNDNIEALGIDGRLILLALMGGGDVEKVDLRKLIGKRIQVKGSTLRNRSLPFQRQLCADFTAFAKPLFHDNKLRAVIDTVLPWTEIIQAHQRMEANEHIGKIVMRIED